MCISIYQCIYLSIYVSIYIYIQISRRMMVKERNSTIIFDSYLISIYLSIQLCIYILYLSTRGTLKTEYLSKSCPVVTLSSVPSVFQCIPVYSCVFQCIPMYSSLFQCIPVYSSVFQCIPVYPVYSVYPVYPVYLYIYISKYLNIIPTRPTGGIFIYLSICIIPTKPTGGIIYISIYQYTY